ncbi:MAG: hypothetical protein II037_02910, partial [Bacteroidales bacterium]|nr:hypothetical protein [Bacteroidales bacterium]
IAKVHFVQHKMSETISPATEKEFHLAAELLVRRLKDNGFAIPELTAGNNIINIDLGAIGIEVYRHDYIGNGYFRFVMNGQKSAEYKICISTEQLAQTITNLSELVSNWLENDYAKAKTEAHKLTKQQKISRLSAQTLLENILKKLEVSYNIEHLADRSEISIALANDKKLHFCINYTDFATEIGKISELVSTARDFSLKFANATITNNTK